MKVLGLGGFLHDASITIIEDGQIIFALEIERITRKKHTGLLLPITLHNILKKLKIDISQIDKIAWADNYLYYASKKAKKIKKWLNNRNDVFTFDHHYCHCASSFYCSPFKEAVVISVDGKGDTLSTLVCYGDEYGLHPIGSTSMFFSLGRIWNATNSIVGMPGYYNSGKTMALSAFGNPIYSKSLLDIVVLDETKPTFKFIWQKKDKEFFFNKKNLISLLCNIAKISPLLNTNEITNNYFNLVASVQSLTNKVLLYLIQKSFDIVGKKPLCLSGGVCLNGLLNTYLLEKLKLPGLFLQPASSDAGLSLGTAILCWHKVTRTHQHFKFSPYLGRSFPDQKINNYLEKITINYTKINNPSRLAAEIIFLGKTLAWFQGREEFGPRALGNRSILCDARDLKNKNYLNQIKQREWFRPFAPSVIEKECKKFFNIGDVNSPYMLLMPTATDYGLLRIPAGLHVDKSGRVQTVSERDNFLFYQLLKEYKKITGISSVLNTSFNLRGEPIVGNIKDAVNCFKKSKIDYMIIGTFLVTH